MMTLLAYNDTFIRMVLGVRNTVPKQRIYFSSAHNQRTGTCISNLSYASSYYAGLLNAHPVLTKALTSGVIAWSGDSVCQLLVEKNENDLYQYDAWRSARFGFLGIALVGPVCHHWYGFLARIIPSQEAWGIARRVFLDQFVFAPVFLNAFCTTLWLLEGSRFNYSLAVYLEQIAQTLPAVLLTNWSLWIPTMALNFRYVPVQYQVLASNVIAMVWNVYLSFKTTKKTSQRT